MRHVASTAGLALALAGALSCASTVESARDRPPLSPAEALAGFQIEPGYRIDLVAAEPLVQDPVAIAFDEDGRLYVAENRGYPDPLDGAPAPPQGVIARLTDTTGDGQYDTRTEFATGLTYPNGIMAWNGGVFVTCAPDLLYLKDTTGDGIADERRVVLTGFNATRTAQIRFSHPTLGPDHWIYLTSGLNGGRVVAPDRPGQPAVEFTSSDSRFNPRTHAFELTGGQGQYGLTFDDHGRRFICANRHPVWHVVLEPRELQRNPHLAFSDAVQEVSTVGAQAIVWPLSPDLTTASFHPTLMSTPHAGTFTSASGVHVHRGDALPAGHAGSLFICESAQNLVQRQVREPVGVTFRSRPARQGAEFLASPDSWFSPVFAANGPDGALYIVDMYRKDIDHPQYVPEPSRRLFDFTAGRDRGRIYRVASADRPPGDMTPDLGQASTEALVAALAHPNAWWRETAQRLLVERDAHDAVPGLRGLADAAEMARLHALWTLDGLAALRDEDLVRALADVHAGVRENAVRLAEGRLGTSALLVEHVLARHLDEAPTVRLRAAIALGHVGDPRAVDALAAIARRDGDDRWMRAAVLSGIGGRTQAFLEAFVAAPASSMAVRAAVMADLGQLYGAAETPERCVALIAEIADPSAEVSWQPAALAGLARGLRARGLADAGQPALRAVLAAEAPRAGEARDRLDTLLARAAALAGTHDAPPDVRLPAIELLGQAEWTDAGTTLVRLLDPQQPTAIQVAAVQAMGQHRDPLAIASLVDPGRWQAYTPQVREVVLTTLLAEDRLVHALLDAIERRAVQPSAIAPSRRTRLTSHRDAAIQQRARALLASVEEGDRMRAYDRLRDEVLASQGAPDRGAGLFAAHCLACHSFDREGGRLGPDLTGIRNQPEDAILLHVLVPDYEITPGYDAYTVETRDGRTMFGRLESESPTSLTLRDAAAQAHVILRTDIASMAAGGTSLMPAGLEEVMDAQALADLIAYLKSPPR
jgi:putative membrane-bound dehydrogenase-like protein